MGDSHNIYLQTLATRGLVGFIPFVAFWIVVFQVLFRSRRQTERNSIGFNLVSGVMGATVAVLIGALTENNLDDSEVYIAYMFLLGMARSFGVEPDQED